MYLGVCSWVVVSGFSVLPSGLVLVDFGLNYIHTYIHMYMIYLVKQLQSKSQQHKADVDLLAISF